MLTLRKVATIECLDDLNNDLGSGFDSRLNIRPIFFLPYPKTNPNFFNVSIQPYRLSKSSDPFYIVSYYIKMVIC